MTRIIAITVLFAFGVVSTARAQYVYTPPVYSPLQAITSDVEFQGRVNSVVSDPETPDPDLQATNDREPRVSLTFASDERRTIANFETFVARTRSENPDGAEELRALLISQPKVIDQMGSVMRRYGLDPYNVADAYALWWASAWMAAATYHDEPTVQSIAAVRDQARAAFGATADFANVGDADRQQYAEALIVQSALLNSSLEQVKGNAEQERALSQAAKQGALASGLNLDTMVLTEQGFVPREGADASDALPGSAENEALASADNAEAGDAMLYAGLAAAVAAGLGGAYALGKRASRG